MRGFTDPKITRIARTDLFGGLPRRDLQAIAQVLDQIDVPAGSTLMAEGEPGLEFFVVLDGYAAVERGGRTLAHVGPGEIVGELAVMHRQPRSATVVARSDMRLLVGERRTLSPLLNRMPSVAERIRSLQSARQAAA